MAITHPDAVTLGMWARPKEKERILHLLDTLKTEYGSQYQTLEEAADIITETTPGGRKRHLRKFSLSPKAKTIIQARAKQESTRPVEILLRALETLASRVTALNEALPTIQIECQLVEEPITDSEPKPRQIPLAGNRSCKPPSSCLTKGQTRQS